MKTSELIEALGEDAAPAPRGSSTRLVGLFTLAGAAVALAALALTLGFRPMDVAMAQPSFWMKAGYTMVLALAGWGMASRLGRPGEGAGRAIIAAAVVIVAIWALAALEMSATPAAALRRELMGQSWSVCPVRIMLLAVPIFAAAVLALRRLAPTRLHLAGAAAGLLAGAAGASVYGLWCTETSAAFTAIWYTLGIAACAAAGALVGPRLLRW